jgi:hypothetical protein
MTNNPRHLSVSNEHFTPSYIIEAARSTLTKIDLDPASSAFANKTVKADKIHTQVENGFLLPWEGNVFLNPPGGRCDDKGVTVISLKKPLKGWTCKSDETIQCTHTHTGVRSSQKRWWKKLVSEWQLGRVKQAIFVGFSLEILQTTQTHEKDEEPSLIPLDFPLCFPSSRVAYFKQMKVLQVDLEDPENEFVLEEGTAPPHASVLIYLPPSRKTSIVSDEILQSCINFESYFRHIGRCIWTHHKQ